MTHILLDIKYKYKENILFDIDIGTDLIYKWCNYNQHHLISKPIMYQFPTPLEYKQKILNKNTMIINNNDNNYNGYTGIGILSESHISIHTYPESNTISIDFYSCKNLDYNQNIQFIKNYLLNNIIDYNFKFIKREQFK